MNFGQTIISLNTVDSTNNYAANMVQAGEAAEGTVVMAQFQENGRGQRGRFWQSAHGANLLMSIILRPEGLLAMQQFSLSQVIGIGLVNYLKFKQINALIKWPNDIYVNGKKIAGTLIENSIRGDKIEYSVAGIGLNVNQVDFENEAIATSIKAETGEHAFPDIVLKELLPYLENAYRELLFDSVLRTNAYYRFLMGYNQLMQFQSDGKIFNAFITGVGPTGKLMLTNLHGEKSEWDFQQIKLVGENL